MNGFLSSEIIFVRQCIQKNAHTLRLKQNIRLFISVTTEEFFTGLHQTSVKERTYEHYRYFNHVT
jgi:hypothetical protein